MSAILAGYGRTADGLLALLALRGIDRRQILAELAALLG